MNKYEVVRDITIAALNNRYIPSSPDDKDNYVNMSAQVAENVAAFFNKIMEQIKLFDDKN